MYKNWPAICAEKDPKLRIVAATARHKNLFLRLQSRWPHLFSERETELRVPASALKFRAYQVSRECLLDINGSALLDAEFDWLPVIREFGIPLAIDWLDEDGPAPVEVLGQLVGQEFRAGMKVTYQSEECFVIAIDDGVGEYGSILERIPQPAFLGLAASRYICFEA